MSEMPSVKCPGEPTRSATLPYTQPMMFMLTVLPFRQARGSQKCIFTVHLMQISSESSYQPSHAELKAKHQVQLLAFEPVDCVCVLGDSQGLSSDAAHARKHESRVRADQRKVKKTNSKIKFYYCVTSYPKTKRPTSHSQNRFTIAPVAKMTLVGLRGGKEKG